MEHALLKQLYISRIKIIIYALLTCIFICFVRLFYLQIDQQSMFSGLGERNFLRVEVIAPTRGNLRDTHQRLLAANRPVFDVYWQGVGINHLSTRQKHMLTTLDTIFHHDPEHSLLLQTDRIKGAEKYFRRHILKRDVPFDQLCQLCEQCGDGANLVILNRTKRVYPYHNLASHILGYLSRQECTGQCGIEKVFDASLQGESGHVVRVMNSTGKQLAQQLKKEAQAGNDVTLTLDFDLQQLAESLFTKGQAGSFLLMDCNTGALRAWVSYPNFDPNTFLEPISPANWERMAENNPLLNRAKDGLYPASSLFKLVTFAAGLEEHVISPESEVTCLGSIEFCGRKYHCMRRIGHGKIDPKKALAGSCNVHCFNIARHISIDTFALYAEKLGLGRKTNFLLSDQAGLIPTSTWKRVCKGERWWKGETLSSSIGQGPILVTPLQVLRMVSSICTGFLVKPRIFHDEDIEKEPLTLARSTINFLRESMHEVVKDGTARILNRISHFDIALKTGTAQTCSLDHEQISKQHLEHAWVAGYFTYKNEQPLAIVMLLENEGSNRPAMQAVEKFLRGYRSLREAQSS